MWQVMKLDATTATMHSLSADILGSCCTSRRTETVFQRVQNTREERQQQKTATFQRWIRMLNLSCSQHDPFRLEIHKSFDCYSLPDMSFQSDPLRAIPGPGSVIYISTTVWSPDFEEHSEADQFYLAQPSPVSRDEEISGPCQIVHAHSIICIKHSPLLGSDRIKSKGC